MSPLAALGRPLTAHHGGLLASGMAEDGRPGAVEACLRRFLDATHKCPRIQPYERHLEGSSTPSKLPPPPATQNSRTRENAHARDPPRDEPSRAGPSRRATLKVLRYLYLYLISQPLCHQLVARRRKDRPPSLLASSTTPFFAEPCAITWHRQPQSACVNAVRCGAVRWEGIDDAYSSTEIPG